MIFFFAFEDEVQFFNKVEVGSKIVQNIMFEASRAIDVPESLSGKAFDFAVIVGRFISDDAFVH